MVRRGLDRELIVSTAMALIDRNGLDALTMRALAAELGVEAPSLYKHVSGKDDILEGVLDVVYAAMRIDRPDAPWQERAKLYARALREAMLAHPHVAPLIATRPVLGASTLELVEQLLQEAADLGFDVEHAVYAVDTMASFIVGHVLAQLSIDPDVGTDPEEVAQIRALLPEEQYPRVRETLGEGPPDRDKEFEYGLAIVINGLEQMLIRRESGSLAAGGG